MLLLKSQPYNDKCIASTKSATELARGSPINSFCPGDRGIRAPFAASGWVLAGLGWGSGNPIPTGPPSNPPAPPGPKSVKIHPAAPSPARPGPPKCPPAQDHLMGGALQSNPYRPPTAPRSSPRHYRGGLKELY